MQPSAYCKVLAIFAISGILSDMSVEDLYSLMHSIMLLSMLIIYDELPHGGEAQSLRLHLIASSATKTKTGEIVYTTQKPPANKTCTHSRNQM